MSTLSQKYYPGQYSLVSEFNSEICRSHVMFGSQDTVSFQSNDSDNERPIKALTFVPVELKDE